MDLLEAQRSADGRTRPYLVLVLAFLIVAFGLLMFSLAHRPIPGRAVGAERASNTAVPAASLEFSAG
jgi:hypothetical protein